MDGTYLGQIIRHARKSAGLRLEDVAELVGVTAGALSHIESGRRLPSPQNAVLIAEALGIPSEELLVALDEEHSSRRRGSVDSWRTGTEHAPGQVYSAMPVEALFSGSRTDEDVMVMRRDLTTPPLSRAMPERTPSTQSASSPARSAARWSDVTSERMEALDELAAAASEAIRTLRGLLDDDDPAVAHEAARLLRELDIRGPGE